MSISTSYPGVYVQEIPSGVRTITGVATSITAFIGRARKGPANEPRTVNGFADFERIFGGLWQNSTVSYAVRSFFLNGGGQAVIVRLTEGATASTIDVGDLHLMAASPGTWSANLLVDVVREPAGADPTAQRFGVAVADLFHLTVHDKVTGESETIQNLTVTAGAIRNVRDVLAVESQLVRTTGDPLPTAPPAAQVNVAVKTAGTDGGALTDNSYIGPGLDAAHQGLYALDKQDLFNLLCIPPDDSAGDTSASVYGPALAYCVKRRAMLIVDPPAAMTKATAAGMLGGLGVSGTDARNAALYFPRVTQRDLLAQGRPRTFVPCGVVAGVMARTDATRGVWKAPAGIDAALADVADLAQKLTDLENGELNPLGINCLRTFPVINQVVWGARTMRGADVLADEWKYLPVRRLALYIEESLFRGTQWVVFEPNDEPLWAQIRLNVGAFMQNLFRQGAFEGTSPRDAYFVKCDAETTTVNDRNLGRVNILVGFAPLRPAEFVILQIQQIARAQA